MKKGDLILRMESREKQAQIDETSWKVRALRKKIPAEKDEAELLAFKLEEMRHLRQIGSVQEEAVCEAKLGLAATKKESLLLGQDLDK